MKLPVLRRIDRQELSSKEALPSWVDPLLNVLNQFIEPVARALQKNLTFEDNFYSFQNVYELTHGVSLAVNPGLKTRVRGVLLLDSSGVMTSGFAWAYNANGSVAVTVNYTDGIGTSAACRILFIGG
jgi:hypothetical protein